jgi:4-amino-4-deoxy-L-arabinose transferase-like glycosyltransferase
MDTLSSSADNLILTAGLFWIVGVAWGAGHFVLRLFSFDDLRPLERAVLSIGLGLGILSVGVLGLGMAGLYRDSAFLLLSLFLTVVTLLALRESAGSRLEGSRHPPVGGEQVFPALLLSAGIFLAWLTALSPPVFFDALEYHLGVPNLFLLRGGIEYLPHMVLSNYPFGTEMLYLLASWLGGLRLAVMVNFALGVLSALVLMACAGRHWGKRAALLAAVLFYLTPMVVLLSRYATSEHAMTFYFFLLVLCLFRWWEGGRSGWVLLAGIFAGFAYGTKFVGGLFAVLIPGLLLVAQSFRRPGRGVGAKAAPPGLFLLGACTAALPWFLKSALFTGNPVYPALNGLFGAEGWGPEQAEMLVASAHASWLVASSWKEYLLLPWYLTIGGFDLGAAAKPGWFWPLALLSSAVLALRDNRWKTRLLLTLMGSFVLLWAATFWMARFLLPASGLAAIAIALVLTEHLPGSLWNRAGWMLVAFLVLFNAVILFQDTPTRRTFRPSLGLQTGDAYLRGLLRSYPAVEYINSTLPHDARVLVLGESRVAYLRRDHVYQTFFDRPLIDDILGESSSPAAMTAALQSEGLTHVLVNVRELERLERGRRTPGFSDAKLRLFLDYLESHGRPLLEGNRVFLLELPKGEGGGLP